MRGRGRGYASFTCAILVMPALTLPAVVYAPGPGAALPRSGSSVLRGKENLAADLEAARDASGTSY